MATSTQKVIVKSEDEIGTKLDRCFADTVMKAGGGLALGIIVSVVLAKHLFPAAAAAGSNDPTGRTRGLPFCHCSRRIGTLMRSIRRRTWPVWLGTGIGLGMGYSNCQHEIKAPFLLHGKKVKTSLTDAAAAAGLSSDKPADYLVIVDKGVE